MFTFVFTIFIPLALSIFFTFYYTKKSVEQTSVQQNLQLFKEGEKNILSYFDLINKASLSVYDGQKYNRSFYLTIKKTITPESESYIYQTIYSIYNFVEDLYQIHLYINKEEISYLFKNYMLGKGTIKKHHLNYSKDRRDVYIESVHDSHNYGADHYLQGRKKVITFHRKIIDIPKEDTIAHLAIDIKLEALENLCRDLFIPEVEKLYIINKWDDTILYCSNPSEVGQKMEKLWYDKVQTNSNEGLGSFSWKAPSFSGMIIYDHINKDYVDWLLVKQIKNEFLYRDANRIVRVNVIIGIVMMLMVAAASLFISFRFTSPIKVLIKNIQKIKKGDLKVKTKVDREDEFGILQNEFHKMMVSLNELIIKEYQLEIMNKENQLKALQAQINPHFINNTLQSIGTEALKHNNISVYQLIIKLGSMLRYAMESNQAIVTLRDEMDYCHIYFNLQKQRFGEQFKFYFDVDDEVLETPIPKMILQPIVENCFTHGFKGKKEHKKIIIRATKKEKKLWIEIEDNGLGISEKNIKELNKLFNDAYEANDKNERIGLLNVFLRLSYNFQSDVSLKVIRKENEGVKVRVIIPIKKTISKKED